jgi:hypothetical protein
MRANDVIQSDQIVFHPAQDLLLKTFAISSLLTVARREPAFRNTFSGAPLLEGQMSTIEQLTVPD